MEKTNLLTLVVTLTVGIILAGSLLMPVLADATTTEKTLTNTGYYRMSETDQETVITWTPSTDPFTFVINGEPYTTTGLDSVSGGFGASYSIAFADDCILRFFYESPSSQNLQYWASGYRGGVSTATLSGGYTATFTLNSSGVSFTTDKPDATISSYTHSGKYFVIDPEGDFIMKNRNTAAYLHSTDSIYYGGGISGLAEGVISSLYLEGNIEEFDVTPMSTSCTVSNEAIIATAVNEYVDLYSLEKLTFTTTYTPLNGDPTDTDQTYSYFAVPYQVTAELSQHLDAGEIALMNALPVLVIIGLVLAGVGAIFVRNRD